MPKKQEEAPPPPKGILERAGELIGDTAESLWKGAASIFDGEEDTDDGDQDEGEGSGKGNRGSKGSDLDERLSGPGGKGPGGFQLPGGITINVGGERRGKRNVGSGSGTPSPGGGTGTGDKGPPSGK